MTPGLPGPSGLEPWKSPERVPGRNYIYPPPPPPFCGQKAFFKGRVLCAIYFEAFGAGILYSTPPTPRRVFSRVGGWGCIKFGLVRVCSATSRVPKECEPQSSRCKIYSASKRGLHKRGIHGRSDFPMFRAFYTGTSRRDFQNRPDDGYPFCGKTACGSCRKNLKSTQRASNPPEFAQPRLRRSKRHRSYTPKFAPSRHGNDQPYIRNGQSTVKGGPKWTKMDLFRPKWTKMDHFSPFWSREC